MDRDNYRIQLSRLSTENLLQKMEYLGLGGINADRQGAINALSYILVRQPSAKRAWSGYDEKTPEQLALIAAYRSLK